MGALGRSIRYGGALAWPSAGLRPRALLLGVVIVLVTLHSAVLAYHVTWSVVFPYDLNYGEGYVLNDALRLSRGESIYVDVQQFPMVRSPYPPLFPLLWSGLIGPFGAVFWPGRLLSVGALIGLAGLLVWNARQVRAGPWPMVVAPALVVASPFVYQWAGYARVDLLALCLAAAGVCVAQWVPGWRGVLGAALLCGLALWTKQTTLTAAAAVAIALSLRHSRHGLGFAALVGVPSALLVAALNGATDGQFGRHVLEGNASNPIYPLRAAYYVVAVLALHLPAAASGVWWIARALRGVPSPIAMYVPVALLGALSAGNAGSSVNYLIEPVVALALALPFAWRAAALISPLVGPLLAAIQLLLLVHWPNTFGLAYLGESSLGRTPTAADAAIGAEVDALVRSEPAEVIAEPAGFAVRNGRPVYVQPIDLRAEEVRGRWRSEPLVEAMTHGRFGMVITAFEFFPSDAERALAQAFTLERTLASPDGLTFHVYRYAR